MSKIRGFLGEQSFEITEGKELLERLAEAKVFGDVYQAETQRGDSGTFAMEARERARLAVKVFRGTRQ
jgi:hypothetical protein